MSGANIVEKEGSHTTAEAFRTNGRYDIQHEDKVQEGTNGVVVDGRECRNGNSVAVKELHLLSPRHQKCYENEVYIMEKLGRYEYLIGCRSAFVKDTQGYIVMDKLLEGDLLEYIMKHSFTEEEVRDLFYQCVLGFRYMHEHTVAHRDIKPENILLQRDSSRISGFKIKICDFGSAIEFDPLDPRVEGLRGTVIYCAPEIKTLLPYDPRKSDVFSLGVLLHVLLTGLFPFPASFTDAPTLEYQPAVMISKQIGHKARDLIGRMLRENPKSRISMKKILRHAWVRPMSRYEPPESDESDSSGRSEEEHRHPHMHRAHLAVAQAVHKACH